MCHGPLRMAVSAERDESRRGLCVCALAAGIQVWLEKGAGTAGVGVAQGAPQGLPCCSPVLCQMGPVFPQKCVTAAPGAGSSPAQPCAGAVEVAPPRKTRCGAELLTAHPASAPLGATRCSPALE